MSIGDDPRMPPPAQDSRADLTAPPTAANGEAACALTVYYDGSCPVCSREIAAYRRQDCTAGWAFVDAAADAGPALGPGLTREAALARMHVRRADGTLVEGAAAFVEMWARVPALAWLARLCRLPGMPPVVEAAYRVFLAVRPLWRRTAPAESAAGGSAKP